MVNNWAVVLHFLKFAYASLCFSLFITSLQIPPSTYHSRMVELKLCSCHDTACSFLFWLFL